MHDEETNDGYMANDEPTEEDNGDATLNDGQEKTKKGGRKHTKKHNIWKRGDQPPILLEINEYSQPVGDNATELSNFIATIVKLKEFLIGYKDWRLVEPVQKLKLWKILKLFYEVDDNLQDWVMGTAAKIWRDFKAGLKKVHFDETKTDKELLAARDERVNASDWKWLINHWRSPLAKECSERGKANRANMLGLHTSGSKSHARVSHEMHIENGFKPRRDEVYIETHTRKNGLTSEEAQATIKALQDAVEEHPEWTEKTINEGDLMSRVRGPERNGFVRSIGKGPTPGDLEMPGKQKYRSTKLQMAIGGHRRAELEKEALIEHFERRQSESNRKLDALSQQVTKLTELLLANSQDGRRAHISPHYESNSPINEDDQEGSANGDAQSSDEENNFYVKMFHRHAAPSQQVQVGGKEVILYSFIRPHDIPVAKATILSTNRMAVVCGTPLGPDCCEVVVNHVLKRCAPLLRPYGDMNLISDVIGRSIAWPRQHTKEHRKSPAQQGSHVRGHNRTGC